MMTSRFRFLLFALSALLSLGVADATAQAYPAEKPMGAAAQQMPGYLAHAGVEQRLGQPLPLSTVFTDETGRTAPLQTWFNGKPAAVALVYYNCAMLCPQVLHGLSTGLRGTTLSPGKDYDVLVFSISPTDTPQDAAMQKAMFLHDLNAGAGTGAGANAGPGAGSSPGTNAGTAVHFLTAKQPGIDAIAGATGFHYVMVPGPDGKMNQYAHSSVVMFATPEGRLSKYLSGVVYEPRDLRLALLGASAHKISNPVDLLILYCCSYNPVVGRYSVSVLRVLGIAGMITLLAVGAMLVLLIRKPRAGVAA